MALEEIPSKRVRGRFVDTIEFSGHPLIAALHPTTIELTKDAYLSKRGDCIIGISANKSVADLIPDVRQALKTDDSAVTIRITVSDQAFEIVGKGDARLTLSHPSEIVLRKSDFVSDRTLAVLASAAAKDMPRRVVGLLKKGERGVMEVEVRVR